MENSLAKQIAALGPYDGLKEYFLTRSLTQDGQDGAQSGSDDE